MRIACAIVISLAALVSTAPAVAAAPSVMPGQWEMTSTTTSIDMPGAPPGIAAMMKGRPVHLSYCVTPEKAKLGPQALAKVSKNCRFSRYDVRGNHIDSEMVCNNPRGRMVVTSSGSFTPTSYSTTGRSVMTGPQRMTIVRHAEGHRVGDCRK